MYRRAIARYAFGFSAAGFLLLASARTWTDVEGRLTPPAATLTAAGAGLMTAIVLVAVGWAALFERPASRRSLASSFLFSQLGKHIPGGIWQFAAQIDAAANAGATPARAVSALPVHLAVQVAAAGTVGAVAAFDPSSVPTGWRVLALAAGGFIVLLNRWLLTGVLRLASRLGRTDLLARDIPAQGAIVDAYRWTVAALALSGASFAVMLRSLDSVHGVPAAMSAFSLAWLAGFLAVPVPAGLGVREAVMLGCLPGSSAAIIAASLCHRLLSVASELMVLAILRAARR